MCTKTQRAIPLLLFSLSHVVPTLWHLRDCPSQARVTSTNCSVCRRFGKVEVMLLRYVFHLMHITGSSSESSLFASTSFSFNGNAFSGNCLAFLLGESLFFVKLNFFSGFFGLLVVIFLVSSVNDQLYQRPT